MDSFQEKVSAAILKRIRARRKSPPGLANRERNSVFRPARLREAMFSDFEQVSELKERSGLAADSIENWERLWRYNPALSETARPIGWVLEVEEKIVGYLGNISLRCKYGSRSLTAVAAHAFSVDAGYRSLTLSLAGAFYGQKDVDLYLTTSAIEATGKLALLFKSAALPQQDYDAVFFWILRAHPFAQSLVKKLDLHASLGRICSLLGALCIATDRLARRGRPTDFRSKLAVSEIELDRVGSDFQKLWDQKSHESNRLFAERTPAALKWHFEIPGDVGSANLLCCYRHGELSGYAVVRNDTDRRTGLRKSIIADMIVLQDDADAVQALFGAAYKCAVRAESDVLEVQGFPSGIRDVLSKFRPYRRAYPASPYYFRAKDPALQRELENPAAWYACPFDGDATLVRPSYSASRLKAAGEQSHEIANTKIDVQLERSEEAKVC